jgi:hypothetical protein
VFVSVTGSLLLLVPCVTLPKAKMEGLADSCKLLARPLPLTGTISGEWGALLPILIVPAALPVTAGENRTVKATEWPGVTVAGNVGPPMLNPVPLTAACDRIKSAFPESLIVRVCVFDTPTATTPKLTLAGTAEICGCIPTPLSATGKVGLLALLVTAMLPVAMPMEVAAKLTLTEACLPGARLSGTAIPLALNPVPVVATFEIVMLLLAVLVRVSV